MVGAQPTIEIVAKENKVMIMDHEAGRLTEEVVEDPMCIPKRISGTWKPRLVEDLPDAFCGENNSSCACLIATNLYLICSITLALAFLFLIGCFYLL